MENQNATNEDCKSRVDLGSIAPISKLIFSVTKLMRRAFDEQARQQDMTLPQWRALAQLVHSDGLSQAALAALIETDPMTTSKIVRLLETRGLIERLPDPADSRAKIVRATSPAAALVDGMQAAVVTLNDAMLDGLGETDKAALVRILTHISQNLTGERSRRKEDA